MTSARTASLLLAAIAVLSSCVPSPLATGTPRPAGPERDAPLMTLDELEARLATSDQTEGLVQTPDVEGEGPSSEPAAQAGPEPDTVATRDTDPVENIPLDDAVAEDTVPAGRWIFDVRNPRVVSVNFLDDPLPDVLTLFSEYAGTSILTSDEEEVRNKLVTANVQAQHWHIALETILRSHGLQAVQDPNTGIIVVQTEARAMQERDPEIIRLRYVYAEDIIETLRTIINGGQQNNTDVINAVKTGSERSSMLMIYTSPEKMRKVRHMVERIDRKRPTVTIEAKMVFVNRSSLEKIGFTYQIVPRNVADSNGGTDDSGANGEPVAAVRPINQSMGPFRGGIPGMPNPGQNQGSTFSLMQSLALSSAVKLNVFFDVLQGTGLAEVQSAPVITTTSDLEASIEVGEFFILPNTQPILTASGSGAPMPGQLPGQFPTGQIPGALPGQGGQVGYPQGGYPGGGAGYPQTGGYGYPGGQLGGNQGWGSFDTGTTLRVTPYVLPNGRVRMNLDISREGGTLAPDGQTITGGRQSTQTEVVVHNNESIVIGGLTVVEKSQSVTGIPVLKDLPLIGALFRTTQSAELHQDLIIIVTPHVIYDEDDDVHYEDPQDASTRGR